MLAHAAYTDIDSCISASTNQLQPTKGRPITHNIFAGRYSLLPQQFDAVINTRHVIDTLLPLNGVAINRFRADHYRHYATNA
jgi:hypothetical protein